MSMALDLHAAASPKYKARQEPRTEEAHLAKILADTRRHSLVMFYSSRCNLCKALQASIAEVEDSEKDWLGVARINTDHEEQWAPEMLHYQVEKVPCLLLLKPSGEAVCKTGPPRSLRHMEDCLGFLLETGRQNRRAR
eukprot:CAMPEP_0117653070 /NCGR_PEP_ID=MMETSP0804-20121206/2990_1 /TAXON_ID=1074897 /ORGANISM="Tetraselmis astigmatica, Strain CCMP880" /LENGTH=137 /DNA_ID=CAMNT_0005459211 /DNA_START=338 /DNA_END=751 /DNA_ORIENTATION=+